MTFFLKVNQFQWVQLYSVSNILNTAFLFIIYYCCCCSSCVWIYCFFWNKSIILMDWNCVKDIVTRLHMFVSVLMQKWYWNINTRNVFRMISGQWASSSQNIYWNETILRMSSPSASSFHANGELHQSSPTSESEFVSMTTNNTDSSMHSSAFNDTHLPPPSASSTFQ